MVGSAHRGEGLTCSRGVGTWVAILLGPGPGVSAAGSWPAVKERLDRLVVWYLCVRYVSFYLSHVADDSHLVRLIIQDFRLQSSWTILVSTYLCFVFVLVTDRPSSGGGVSTQRGGADLRSRRRDLGTHIFWAQVLASRLWGAGQRSRSALTVWWVVLCAWYVSIYLSQVANNYDLVVPL